MGDVMRDAQGVNRRETVELEIPLACHSGKGRFAP
jgi:hypothetical protein